MSYLMFHCALGVFLSMFLKIFQFGWVRYMQLKVDHCLDSFPVESYFYVLLKEIRNFILYILYFLLHRVDFLKKRGCKILNNLLKTI